MAERVNPALSMTIVRARFIWIVRCHMGKASANERGCYILMSQIIWTILQRPAKSVTNIIFSSVETYIPRNSIYTLQWRHNGHDGVSNHQPHDCFLNRLFRRIKENIKAPRHWPLCGEFIGDRWFPRTNGQQRGKCFHLMKSPWTTPQITMGSCSGVMHVCLR